MGALFFVLFMLSFATRVDSDYDIRKYYHKPYCEERKVGAELIKKCYELKEITK